MCFPVIVSNVRQAAEGVALAVWASAGHVAPVTAEHTEAGSGAESGTLKSPLACRAAFFLTFASDMAQKSSFIAWICTYGARGSQSAGLDNSLSLTLEVEVEAGAWGRRRTMEMA